MQTNHPTSESARAIEETIHTFYELNSGCAGQVRDWNQLRELFIPGATLVPHSMVTGAAPMADVGLDAYIGRVSDFLDKNDFFEKGIIHNVEIFGSIASVISTYEARLVLDEPKPFRRGVNFIHLMHDGRRWRIAGMVWLHESDENPLPDPFLPSTKS